MKIKTNCYILIFFISHIKFIVRKCKNNQTKCNIFSPYNKCLLFIAFNPNVTRGGGPQKPILHFFMENHPTFQYILFKEYKTNRTSKFGSIFSKASTIILHFQKFEKLFLKRVILSMGF